MSWGGGETQHSPDPIGHLDVLVSVHLEGKLELAVKAAGGEEAVQEGVEQPLVKLVVDAAAVDGLSHQRLQGCPRDLVWRDVLTTLDKDENGKRSNLSQLYTNTDLYVWLILECPLCSIC